MTNRAFDQWLKNIEKRPALAVTLSIIWVILIGWVAYGWNLGSTGLIDETEPLFAEASRQMYITGDWVTPFFNGETRFDKPALIYWCQAIAYAIIGVNEWAVRLPSAMAAIAVIALVFYTIQWVLSRQDHLNKINRPTRRWLTAGLAAALVGFNAQMIIWGHTGVSDMLLTGCIASALLCFFLGYASKQETDNSTSLKWYLATYVLIAGAILTKGPVGIVLPGLIIGIFLLYLGNLREVLREMRPLMGMLIIFGLSAPWYALVIWRNGWDYINSFFGYHNLERFTGVVNRHSAPWYFYFIVVLLGSAPYSVYLPMAIAKLKFWQRSYWRSQERLDQLGLFAFFWFVSVFGFFTIAVTKLPSYVLPLIPAAAILIALLWSDFFSDSETNRENPASTSSFLLWCGWANVVLLSALGVALFHIPQILGDDPAAPNFRQLLQESGLAPMGGVIWLVGAVIIAVLLLRRRWVGVMNVNLLGFLVFLVVVLTPAMFLMDQERQLPLRQLSSSAVKAQKTNEELVMVGFKKPSVVFYTKKQVKFIKLTSEGREYIQIQTAKKVQPASMLILSQAKKLGQMGLQPSDYEKLDSRGAYQLVRLPLKN